MQENVKQIIEEYQQKLIPVIKKYIENKSLLDVGCGNGLNSFFFHKKCGTSVTLSDIEDIRDKEAIPFRFLKLSLEDKLPFKTKSFDVVFVQYVLHHLPSKINLKDIFSEFKRVGKIVIVVEEIITEKTDIQRAKEFDSKINDVIHPLSNYTEIYKYYSDTELKDFFANAKANILKEKIFDKGCEDDGFLQRKIYILS